MTRRLWLLPALLAAACLLAIAALRAARAPGAVAEVLQDGVTVHTLPLSEDASVTVYAPGGGSNTVTVSGGRVCVSRATCPDQVCVHQGWVSDTGTPIVCLPNHLVIQIRKGELNLDAVAG